MPTEPARMKSECMSEALSYLREAVQAKKCWSCGCFQDFLKAIDVNFPESQRTPEFEALIKAAREMLTHMRYDCLGCELCYPPTVLNILEQAGIIEVAESSACFTEKVQEREGWPPLPGSYRALRYHAPVAVCTLTNEELASAIMRKADPAIAIAGTLQTENIGIERLLLNVLGNPNIRFLIVCGPDSKRAIGHLPGQSLVSLARQGLDKNRRILGARGKRPVLHNVSRETVEHFRRTVEVVDLVGNSSLSTVLETAHACDARNPGAAEPFTSGRTVRSLQAYLPKKMVPDPTGYFVVYVDRARRRLSLEHYSNEGLLDVVIEGIKAAELYTTAIDHGLVSRLDHADYLGQELARAEKALITGEAYVQDGAPEHGSIAASEPCCTCGPHVMNRHH